MRFRVDKQNKMQKSKITSKSQRIPILKTAHSSSSIYYFSSFLSIRARNARHSNYPSTILTDKIHSLHTNHNVIHQIHNKQIRLSIISHNIIFSNEYKKEGQGVKKCPLFSSVKKDNHFFILLFPSIFLKIEPPRHAFIYLIPEESPTSHSFHSSCIIPLPDTFSL